VPKNITCLRNAVWLPLEWENIPRNTAEVVVALQFNELQHGANGSVTSKLVSEAIIGNLSPHHRELAVGVPPKGSFIKHHYAGGYCPPLHEESGIVFSVYAIPRQHRLKRYEAVGLATLTGLDEVALASGSLATLYGGD